MSQWNKIYGYVTRFPKNNNEMYWRVVGHEGYNPEGSYLYEFSDDSGWRLPIKTQLDYKYFADRPDDYQVEALSGRPGNQRPQRKTPIQQFDEMAKKTDAKRGETDYLPPAAEPVDAVEIPTPQEQTPASFYQKEIPKVAKRQGRPPKAAFMPETTT